MATPRIDGSEFSFEESELKGFSRTIAEIEWLLLVLVLLYMVVTSPTAAIRAPIFIALSCFAVFILVFRYANFYKSENRWKLAIETWVMIVFITWVLWHTGKLESPLLNLYLLTIIISALTLGKSITLLEMALIGAVYVFLGYSSHGTDIFAPLYGGHLMAQLGPMVLVAYLTTMLSADIHYAVSKIRLRSETDELTGLLNMRAFAGVLEREAKQSARYSRSYSVIMLDSDNLKSINDTYGHETGNKLLKHLVSRIQSVLRSTDVLARYGGDEFVVLLPETAAEGAREVAERIRESVQNAHFEVKGDVLPVTVSIGIATYPVHGHKPEQILNKADKAMYHSKTQGKNMATWYTES